MIDFKDTNLKNKISKMHPYEIANIFTEASSDEKKILITLLNDVNKNVYVFETLDEENRHIYFEMLTPERKKNLLNRLQSDELTNFLQEFKEEKQQELLKLLKEPKRKALVKLLSFEQNKAGSMMITEFVTLKKDMTVKEATNHIITNSKESDFIDMLFVVDENEKIIGTVDLKDLIVARAKDPFEDLINYNFNFVYHDELVFKAIDLIQDYDEKAIPVINYDDQIEGVITADDILNELMDQRHKDFEKISLLGDHNPTDSSIKRFVKRLPWLVFAVIVNLLVANLVMVYEKTLTVFIGLFFFQSMVLDTSGNIATQALSVTLLKISSGELDDKEKRKTFIKKEMGVAFLNSISSGLYAFIISFAYLNLPNILTIDSAFASISPMIYSLFISGTVFLTLVIASNITTFAGYMIPILVMKKGKDPANVSGPLILTTTDITGQIVYYTIATAMLAILRCIV